MKRGFCALFVLVLMCVPVLSQEKPTEKPEKPDTTLTFTGEWKTTFGPMKLTQTGNKVEGYYLMGTEKCVITGTIDKQRLNFTYKETEATGEGWFELAADGKSFAGKWRVSGEREYGEWVGVREAGAPVTFHGLWQTSFGRMRLVQTGDKVEGIYNYGSGATLSGTVEKQKLTFKYKDEADGEGWFELTADGQAFKGQWKPAGAKQYQPWTGQRVNPKPGVTWLVIVEANWEGSLADQEYAFGEMLRAFFKRSAAVQVRHRFFRDEAGLKKWCQEVTYLAEPTVLVMATHGTPKGVPVENKVVGGKAIGESLRYASNLQLVHFSACCIMKETVADDIHKALDKGAKFPVSGYKTEVDWAGSAIIEFTYLDMILMRGKTVKAAAEQVEKLLPFSGDKDTPGAAIRAAGFRVLMPK